MNICDMSLVELKKKLDSGELTSLAIVEAYKAAYEADEKTNKPLKGYIEFYADALDAARKADAARAAGDKRPLLGLPFALKDNISVRGKSCTCGSKILAGYVAPYNATVAERLIAAGAIPMGRTNMDEFAMGSSTEYSCYGPSRNPVNRDLVPGGSSGGSAAVVAGGQAPFALGTETGGSVRLPASYCGLYGLKTTYGTLSRYGVVAFGSSLDQVGLLSHSVDDLGLALSVMAGRDERDDTSADLDFSSLANLKPAEIKGLKVAIPKEFMDAKGLDPEIAAIFERAREWFVSRGAVVETVSIPVLEASIGCYYVIALSEAASNLSRFDGIRYGLRKDPGDGFDELYVATRSDGFNAEVKRRIVIGNYVLSTHFSGDCYKKGMSVRARIQRDVGEVFKKYDVLICPTSPTVAFPIGSKVDDPLAMYLSDLFTTFVNLARIPSLSVPFGTTKAGLPVGVQIAGAHFAEEKILKVAKAWEASK
ncbi:MAG TPA: Asp-tRNA(Asn)/Glu-tRNA(Gln) amidotransferase subunit GatA [Treponemataceae bacterium]|nr:Asp-tRNA(Asn)/Glu-tRNA(Gln) amidotransferase subunit GatA [Treponemataceae bacterium]